MNIGVEQREIVQGLTSWDSVIGYRGPCPPSGSIHRYKLHFYCLNKSLKSHAINEKMTKKKFIREIIDSDMIIYSGEIMGTYEQP